MSKNKKTITIKDNKKNFELFQSDIFDDLQKFSNKYKKPKNVISKLEHFPFILQLQEGYHNLFEMGYCKHQVIDISKEAFKKALDFQKSKFN